MHWKPVDIGQKLRCGKCMNEENECVFWRERFGPFGVYDGWMQA